MQIRPANIPLAIVLTFFTGGLYGLYWLCRLTNETHELSRRPQTPGGIIVVLLSIVTCGLYAYYWLYRLGGELVEMRRERGLPLDSVPKKTYMLAAVILTCFIAVFYFLYAVLFSAGQFANIQQSSPQLPMNFALLFSTIIGIDILVLCGFVQSVILWGLIWLIYKRSDPNPRILYIALAASRTSIFTLAFLQHSLNDLLQGGAEAAPAHAGAPLPGTPSAPVPLEKPHP